MVKLVVKYIDFSSGILEHKLVMKLVVKHVDFSSVASESVT